MPKWVVLLGADIDLLNDSVVAEEIVLVPNKKYAERVMYDYLDRHPEAMVVGFRITKEVPGDE